MNKKSGGLLRGKETAFVVNKGNHALPSFFPAFPSKSKTFLL